MNDDTRTRTSTLAAAAFTVAAGAIGLPTAPALAEPKNTVLRQVTDLTVGTIEVTRLKLQDGMEIAFISDGDVMGPGTETLGFRNLYYWVEDEDTGVGTMKQVTNNTDCQNYDAYRPTDTVFSDRPKSIAFVSTCDHDPDRDNSDGNPEIFFYDIDNDRFHQITDTTAPVVNGEPFTSDSGLCLVFSSNGDLDNNVPSNPVFDDEHPGPGFSNPDGSTEVFLYGKITGKDYVGNDSQIYPFPHNGTFAQASNGPAGTTSGHPGVGGYWFARQCQSIIFHSDYDQLGQGNTGGRAIYVYKRPLDFMEPVVAAEIPNGFPPGDYANPSISQASPFARGPHIAFEAGPDLWNNGSQGRDLFNWRDFHPRMTQFTNVGAGFSVFNPEVSDGGGVFVFASDGELLSQNRETRTGEAPPFNPDANKEIFRLKGRRRAFQITDTTGCESIKPTLKDDGKMMTFISNCDLIGTNPTGTQQVFKWSMERHRSALLVPGQCEIADRCCLDNKDPGTSCYHHIKSRAPKRDRPNCLDKDRCRYLN